MTSKDAIDFVVATGCKDAADEIANNICICSGPPTADEVLSRCRHVFEYILHQSLNLSGSKHDLSQFEVEIQCEKEI